MLSISKSAPQIAVCDACGGTEVAADAYARWDVAAQEYTCDGDVFDKGSACETCDCECRIEMRDATPEEIAQAGPAPLAALYDALTAYEDAAHDYGANAGSYLDLALARNAVRALLNLPTQE